MNAGGQSQGELLPTVIVVPAAGFVESRAREILRLSVERWAELQGELVYGEWRMVRGREHVTLAGMRRLVDLAGIEGLEFEKEGEGESVQRSVPRSRLVEWELENER